MQTVPSLLEKTPQDLFFQINRLSKYFSRFQIDIADGIFVPNKTVQIDEIEKNLNQLINKNVVFDFHLMVKGYEEEIKKLEKLKEVMKVNYIFIHFPVISNLSSSPIGLTLNPQDQVEDLANQYNLNKIPFLQIMSVNPGFQGSPFLPEMLNKIEQLRNTGYRKEIFLDGSVNEKTIPVILSKKYRPDFICPGSYLTKTEGKELEKRKNYLSDLL
jgi:pentose-5-phosphate-3-epimerase